MKTEIEKNLKDLEKALMSESFPCNPIPFANGIIKGVKLYGTDWIKTDQAKRILFILISQSYTQLFRINSLEEHIRLAKEL